MKDMLAILYFDMIKTIYSNKIHLVISNKYKSSYDYYISKKNEI